MLEDAPALASRDFAAPPLAVSWLPTCKGNVYGTSPGFGLFLHLSRSLTLSVSLSFILYLQNLLQKRHEGIIGDKIHLTYECTRFLLLARNEQIRLPYLSVTVQDPLSIWEAKSSENELAGRASKLFPDEGNRSASCWA